MDEKPAVYGLHHFAWRCRDAEETRVFYEDVLGLPLAHVIRNDSVPSTGEHCPHTHLFFRMVDGSFMAFFDLGDDKAPEPSLNTPDWVNHIALRVANLNELKRAKRRIEEAGYQVVGVTDHGFIKSIYMFDPNGLRVELTTLATDGTEMTAFEKNAPRLLKEWTEEKQARITLVETDHGD